MNKKTFIALYLIFVGLLIGIILSNPGGMVDSIVARFPKSDRMSSLEAQLAASSEVFDILQEVMDVSRLQLEAGFAVSQILGKSFAARSAAKVFKMQPDGKSLIETRQKIVDAHDRQHKAEHAALEAQDKERDASYNRHNAIQESLGTKMQKNAVLAKKQLDAESRDKARMAALTSWAEASLQHYVALQAPNDALENAIEAFKAANAHLAGLIADNSIGLSDEELAQLESLIEANTLVIAALEKLIWAKRATLDAANKGLETLKARFGDTATER